MDRIIDKIESNSFFLETNLSDNLIIDGSKIEDFNDLRSIIINPLCILGLPGMADIGKMASDQLIQLLNAKRILEITFDDFPAGAIVTDSILYSPRAEIYLFQDPGRMQDILIFTADAQPMSPKGIHSFSRYIAKLIHLLNGTLVISLGAYPVEQPSKNNYIYVAATSEQMLNNLGVSKQLINLTKGVIIGANGLVSTFCKNAYNIDGVILLSETNGFEAMKKDAYDVKASMTLLEVLSKEFHLNINIEKLDCDMQIENLEAKIKEEKESIKRELNSSKKRPMTLPYFG